MNEHSNDTEFSREYERTAQVLSTFLNEPGYIDFREVAEIAEHLPMVDATGYGEVS